MHNDKIVRIVAVGDIQPNRAEPETLLEGLKSEFGWGDIRCCQLECTLSELGEVRSDVQNPAHQVPPENVRALTSVGINLVTYAGNNNLDYGISAFTDTLRRLEDNSIKYVGAGRTLDEARAPAYIHAKGMNIAWINACCILREGYAATDSRAGIAPLKVSTYYQPLENIYEQPGTPAKTITVPDPYDLAAFLANITEARERADVVIASLHWGVHFTHDLAAYQPEVAYAVIDAGCDLVLGTHPHCLQAVDVYKGKYIFYSLGNFAFEQPESLAREGVKKYLAFYDLPVESAVPNHPHPRHCRLTVLLQIGLRSSDELQVTLIPVHFADTGRPERLWPGSETYKEVVDLLTQLCEELGTQVVETSDGTLTVGLEKTRAIDTRTLIRSRADSYPWLRKLTAV